MSPSASPYNTCLRPYSKEPTIYSSVNCEKAINSPDPLLGVHVINNGQVHSSNDHYLPISLPELFHVCRHCLTLNVRFLEKKRVLGWEVLFYFMFIISLSIHSFVLAKTGEGEIPKK